MENRLELNKRPTYELPDEVLLGQYTRSNKKEDTVPEFEPDVIICNWGAIRIAEKKKATAKQLWIKSDNKKLLNFIKEYDWKNCTSDIGTPFIGLPKFKQILLKEYYGK